MLNKLIKNIVLAVLVCLCLAGLFSLIQIQPVHASSTVSTSTIDDATLSGFQRKTFYAAGRHWAFYFDGFSANTVFSSSLDGLNWNAPTLAVIKCSNGHGFSLFYNGSHIAYARTMGTISSPIYYRLGVPQTDGTISWTTTEQTAYSVVNKYPNFLTIALDSAGYPWIGFRIYDAVDIHAWVTKSSKNDGTWTTQASFPYTPTATTDSGEYYVTVLPQTSQNVYLLYQARNAKTLKGKQWYGSNSSWNAEETVTPLLTGSANTCYSAVNQGNDIQVVFDEATTNYIQHVKRTGATESWSTNTTVQASTTATSSPVLSTNKFTNDLYCFWAGSPTANHVYYKKYASGSWDAGATDWFLDNPLTANDRLTCSYQSYTSPSIFGLLYSANTSSPYGIRYAFLSVTDPPSNDACSLSNPFNSTCVLARWSTAYTYLVNVNVPSGFRDLNYVDLRLEQPAGLYASVIVRYTENNASFFIQAGSSYISLGSCSNTSSSTYSNLTFSVVFDWDYPLTSDIDAQVYSLSDAALSDTDTFNSNMDLITTLTTTPVTSDARQNTDDIVTISGPIYYTSTTTQVSNAEISANGVVVHNSTHVSQGTASATPYSISVTLPSLAQLNTYHIYFNGAGDYVDGDIGSTVNVISDRLTTFNVQPVQYQGSGAFYYQAQIEWAYDNITISGATVGVVYPNGTSIGSTTSNSTGWATFIINQSNATDGIFSIYGVNDNNYTITTTFANATFTLYDWALTTSDIAGSGLSNTNLGIGVGPTTVWNGTQRTLYVPGDTFAISVTWLTLPVNTTASVTVSGSESNDFNCTVYPILTTSYHYASNATISSTSYASNVLTISFSGATSTYILAVDNPTCPTFILNVTYNYAVDFTPYGYLVLPHYGNATLTVSYESFGSLYIRKTTHKFLTVTLASQILSITTTGTSGDIGTIEVYCGTWGNAVSTTGWIATSYSSTLSTLTGTLTFASDKTVTLTWVSSGGGPSGGGPGGPAIQPLMATVVLSFPARSTLGTTINAFINITWTGVNTVTVQEIFIDLAPFNSWQLLVPDGLPQQLVLSGTMGTATIPITLNIPEDVEPGTYVVPCIVSFGWQEGAGTKTFRTVSTLEIVLPPPTVPDLMTYFWVGMFAALGVGMLLFRSRRRH